MADLERGRSFDTFDRQSHIDLFRAYVVRFHRGFLRQGSHELRRLGLEVEGFVDVTHHRPGSGSTSAGVENVNAVRRFGARPIMWAPANVPMRSAQAPAAFTTALVAIRSFPATTDQPLPARSIAVHRRPEPHHSPGLSNAAQIPLQQCVDVETSRSVFVDAGLHIPFPQSRTKRARLLGSDPADVRESRQAARASSNEPS